MLERELDWRRLRSLQAIGFVCGGVVSIGLALAGAGVLRAAAADAAHAAAVCL